MTQICDVVIKESPDAIDAPITERVALSDQQSTILLNGWADAEIKSVREAVIEELKQAAVLRIRSIVPALGSMDVIALMVVLWPGLNAASLGDGVKSCKKIYLYARDRIAWAQTAAIEDLQSYDPSTDSNWPP